MPDTITDEVLLERAGRGDQAAFIRLYERYRDPIFRFAYRLSGSRETAEDITHDCFLGLIWKPQNFEAGRASLRTYLYAAARNLALKHFRRASREIDIESASGSIDEQVSSQRQPLTGVLGRELSEKVREAILNLPPLQREVLILYEYEGLKLNEISQVVDAEVGAVKARLHRARAGLKGALIEYLNSDPEIVTLEKA